MHKRGSQYWAWSDCALPSRTHEEMLADGTAIEVQARLSRRGETQMFLGVYAKGGALMVEEYYESCPGESLARASVWGVQRARAIASGADVGSHAGPAVHAWSHSARLRQVN
jgi:hypothetical protein